MEFIDVTFAEVHCQPLTENSMLDGSTGPGGKT